MGKIEEVTTLPNRHCSSKKAVDNTFWKNGHSARVLISVKVTQQRTTRLIKTTDSVTTFVHRIASIADGETLTFNSDNVCLFVSAAMSVTARQRTSPFIPQAKDEVILRAHHSC